MLHLPQKVRLVGSSPQKLKQVYEGMSSADVSDLFLTRVAAVEQGWLANQGRLGEGESLLGYCCDSGTD